ncbi:MAG: hypothetical protein ABIP30_08295 [Ferruginibacter sp.]
MKKLSLVFIFTAITIGAFCQVKQDSIPVVIDTIPLRIKNLNPYFTIQVDSALRYQLMINKDVSKYYFFLKNSPVGLKINKDNGLLSIKVDKSYFLSGRLKYDYDYKVNLSVQNLDNPLDKVDTSFTILFYSTEIIPSKVKPTVTNSLIIEEGDTVSFKIQCDNGSFPIEDITYISNYPIKSSTPVAKCGDDFTWYAPFDFVKPGDKDKQRKINLYFIGTNKFHTSDTARIEITVKENINYPQQVMEFQNLQKDTRNYIIQLKSSFRIVDRKIKKTKGTRTGFDLASASTALGGTIFSSLPNTSQQSTGKILPSVGVALVPVKEATAPNSSYEQNTATLIRSSIKRLEYLLTENTLVGDRDPDIITKTNKIKDELKQTQIQLIDIPIADAKPDEKEVDEYFNNPKVNKKYRMKKK